MTAHKRLKIVAVGDGAVGKTSLLVTFAEGRFPVDNYVPTVFDNYERVREYKGEEFVLCLWDTAGQEEYSHLRPISYPDTDVFLLCFALDNVASFRSLERWKKELAEEAPGAPFLLVGTKGDLRSADKPGLDEAELEAYARKLGAIGYVECSAKLDANTDAAFDAAFEHWMSASRRRLPIKHLPGRRKLPALTDGNPADASSVGTGGGKCCIVQ